MRPGARSPSRLSDTFCVDRHRDGFNELLDTGRIDILFANQAEVEALAGIAHLEEAVAAVKDKVEILVVTRSEDGALATRGDERADVPAEPHREIGRHYRRWRPFRRRLPVRPRTRTTAWSSRSASAQSPPPK